MAITFPYDLLAEFPGWSTEFDLFYRQEQSRSAGGRTYVKDFGSPLWRATYQSRTLRINELDEWRARLNVLDNGLNTFLGRPTSRCYPIKDPRGEKLGPTPSITVGAILTSRKELTIAGLPNGYVLTPGDQIKIGARNLHRVVNATPSGAGGATSSLEVRPHLWPETMAGDPVQLIKPDCRMVIMPGSVNTLADLSTGRGAISFQAIEAR